MDTRNDTAIAKVLQAEEEAQAGLPLAPPPSSSGSQAARDYKLALVMQEECDAEMASRMQHEEREMAGGGSYGERVYGGLEHSTTRNAKIHGALGSLYE